MIGWPDATNVLCVRLDNAGDVLMTTPALRALKHAVPRRRLTLLSSSAGCALARYVPEIDAAIRYDAPWVKNDFNAGESGVLQMRDELAAQRFDAAVIFTVYSQSPLASAMLCYLAGVPLRLAHCRENPYQLLTDWIREIEPHERVRHEVQRQLDLVAAIGARPLELQLSFAVVDQDRGDAIQKLRDAGIDTERDWLTMHPVASAPSRRYPAERFAHIARELVTRLDCQIALTGDASETALAEYVRQQAGGGVFSVAGELQLNELGAAIS